MNFLIIAVISAVVTVMYMLWQKMTNEFETRLDNGRLLSQARQLFPGKSDLEALDSLCSVILRRMKAARMSGEDTEDLERDLFDVLNERLRILGADDSSFSIVH